jgi:hypothetical protein
MGALHTDMGSLLFLLYTTGVWFLQRTPREPFLARHCWSDCFLDRHCGPFLCGLSCNSLLSPGLQSQAHCH